MTAMTIANTYPRINTTTRDCLITAKSRSRYEYAQPAWPVSTQFEKVVEVAKPDRFQLNHQIAQHVVGWERPDRDQASLYHEFLIGQVEASVNYMTLEPRALEGFAPDKNRRTIASD